MTVQQQTRTEELLEDVELGVKTVDDVVRLKNAYERRSAICGEDGKFERYTQICKALTILQP